MLVLVEYFHMDEPVYMICHIMIAEVLMWRGYTVECLVNDVV